MSDEVLLTREDVDRAQRANGGREGAWFPSVLINALLRTVDAAHGVLRDEMRAALKGQLEQLLAEKEAKIEELQGLIRSAEPGTENMCPWCGATVCQFFDENADDGYGGKGALVALRSPNTPHRPECKAAEYFGDGRSARWAWETKT